MPSGSLSSSDQTSFGFTPARPFLKWAGGKRQLLPSLLAAVPSSFGQYFEPFLGGGALFYALQPPRAVLGDANARLIRTYRAVQQCPGQVAEALRTFRNEKAFFLRERSREIDQEDDVSVAAWFIFMNRTAFNGLYRVNRQGRFNVPFGHYKNPRICDADNLVACAAALRSAALLSSDFGETVEAAGRGDFVYFDPPYVPLSGYSDFSRYTEKGFSLDEQVRLRDVARELKRRGVSVLLSNSDTVTVWDLYRSGFEIRKVSARRHVSAQARGRKEVAELLIR